MGGGGAPCGQSFAKLCARRSWGRPACVARPPTARPPPAPRFARRSYPPSGFNYGDDSTPPVVDDITLENYNLPERVNAFVATAQAFAGYTQGDVMWTMVSGRARDGGAGRARSVGRAREKASVGTGNARA